MNKNQTIDEFIRSARSNAFLLKKIIAAVYGTSEDNITICTQIDIK